jgi:energy-converting hydrogenase Eha subunit E
MADLDDQRFQLFMSEKAFADSQIGGFFDLHVKVLTFLGAAFVLLGWLYAADKPKPVNDPAISFIALAVVVVGCSVILQAVVLYGSSLGYLEYKITTLSREFARMLSLDEMPFTTFRDWRWSSTQPPVSLSAIALFIMHLVASALLLCVAWNYGRKIEFFSLAVIGTTVYLAVTLCAEVLMFRAMRILMKHGTRQRDVVAANSTSGSNGTE